MVNLLLVNGLATVVIMVLLWILSRRLQDVSIVDIYWGPGFAVIATMSLWQAQLMTFHNIFLTALAALWGLRLGGYLLGRWFQKDGEDPRYAAMRRNRSPNFELKSLWVVFLFQSLVMWVVALPLQMGIGASDGLELPWLMAVGVALFAIGFFFEAVGDAQLARFRADPANKGKVMDRGLWAWTRHPNYFGDAVIMWAFYLMAISGTPGAWWTVFAPAIMTYFLLRVSGVAMMERGLSKTKPHYADYVARTSVFIPLPPKRNANTAPRSS